MTSCADAQQKQNMNKQQSGSEILVTYFSATGTTSRVAEQLANAINGDLHEISPALPYSSADLDWHNKNSRSSVEMNNPDSRPEIKEGKVDMKNYNVIFIGYPIWWDFAPRIINTFIESYDFSGKKVVPFATSGGSGIVNSVRVLRKEYHQIDWCDGKLLNSPLTAKQIEEWLKTVKAAK